eukprot:4897115-Alexandrium_andersonii.AAC.1
MGQAVVAPGLDGTWWMCGLTGWNLLLTGTALAGGRVGVQARCVSAMLWFELVVAQRSCILPLARHVRHRR